MKKSLKAIDLFAGAGGFSLAALRIGINVVAALENNKHACTTYEFNFIKSKSIYSKPLLFREDIETLDPHTVLEKTGIKAGEIDILMGGPPCQGYSRHRLKNSGVDDPRNRLLLKYFHYVTVIKPKVFIVENVPGLLWEKHKKYLDKFYELAQDANYKINPPCKLNARDFGVPQNRQRIFILGMQEDINIDPEWPPAPTHFNPHSKEVINNGKPAWIKAKIAFKMPLSNEDENNIYMKHTPELIKVFKSTPKNGGSRQDSNRILNCHKKHNGHKDVYGRIDPEKPGPTITTGCINPSKGRFVHPNMNHGITARHAARLQSFPDNFIFKGGLMASAIQIGNAVPIKLGKIILSAIAGALKKV